MNEDQEILLEKWFDGEASPADASTVETLLEKDPEARAFLKNLRQIRDGAQASFKGEQRFPTWKQLSAGRIGKARRPVLPFSDGTKRLAGLAAIVLLGMAIWMPFRYMGHQSTDEIEMVNRVEVVETDLEGATPVVYLDQPSGWTVVWVLESEDPTAGS